jgi:hypothetical protein
MAKDEHTEKPTDEELEHGAPQTNEQPEEGEEKEEKSEDSQHAELPAHHEHGASKAKPHHRLLNWCRTNKKLSIPLAVAVVLAIIFVVPALRYSVLGLFLKQNFSVVVLDEESGSPVSSASLSLGGVSAKTDAKGKATLKVPVGPGKLEVTKAYYKTADYQVTVPIQKPASAFTAEIRATGRPVPVTVVNSITRKPVAGVNIVVGQAQAKTDDKGLTTLVVPVGAAQLKTTLSADGYNTAAKTIVSTTEVTEDNVLTITPAGKVYFLSDQSGKLDVVKTNLDGTDRKVVVKGTGKEHKRETVLLATRDWKYLALKSRRDGGDYDKLFLINTADDSIVNMDEGLANFTLVGWEDHRFIYEVDRVTVMNWQPKRYALKSYDAEKKKLTTLDQTRGEGSNQTHFKSEFIGNVYVLNHSVVYIKGWSSSHVLTSDKTATLNTVSPDGSNRKTVKSFAPVGFNSFVNINSRVYDVDELYFQPIGGGDEDRFYEYENGSVKEATNITSSDFYDYERTTYLVSPSGKQAFWYSVRDGKRAFFVGTPEGKQGKQVVSLSDDYATYGWYTDDYLLISKDGSELYILPVTGIEKEAQLFKVSDYFRPDNTYYGYGGGYGGL